MNPNPTQFDEKSSEPEKSPKARRPRSGLGLWLDNLRCKVTVRAWKRKTKKQKGRSRFAVTLRKMPHAAVIGSLLYLVGFWVEYTVIRLCRAAAKATTAILLNAGTLLGMILRPFVLGLLSLWEDLTGPFVRMMSGLRHIQELPQAYPEESARAIRAEKWRYFFRGAKLYFPLVWNALSYILPVAAAVALGYTVRTGLGYHYILNVQVNGESVGFVESEQIFESAREDVQSRINNAKAVMEAAGNVVPDTQWDVNPTYTLAISGRTMSESEVANAILRASSDEIGEGTAVYVDGALRFVTTQGDHLRTYLERVKAPFENQLDPDVHVNFVHNIQLVDGVYLLSSIVPYDTVVSTLNEGAQTMTYTAAAGDTVQMALDATGVSFDTLAALNTDLTTTDQELEEGRTLITGVASPELLKVKVVVRQTYMQEVQYESQETESDEYDFGKVVTIQEGEMGMQEMTEDMTYVDGVLLSTDIVNIESIKQPVTKLTVRGTKLKSGMVASTGSGTFAWPVPQYKYVSRWMSSYHKGADICAAYGTPIIASDSGVITTATMHYSYGNYITIDHGNGYTTLYAHMSGFADGITVGTPVKQGQIIGYVGSTGDSTGNHCHFEMFQNGNRFSAQNLFPGM